MTPSPLHNAAVGIADLTLEVCLLASLSDTFGFCSHRWGGRGVPAAPLGRNKRPQRSILCSWGRFVVPAAHSIRVPIHITQVPRG